MSGLMFPNIMNASASLGVSPVLLSIFIAVVATWTIVLKGFALWHSARNYQKRWFIVLLIVNTFGILEIIYLAWFRKDKQEGTTPSLFNTPEGPVSSPSA